MVEVLRTESLESIVGIKKIEQAAAALQYTLQTKVDDDIHQMSAIADRIAVFGHYSDIFSTRLLEFMAQLFQLQTNLCMQDESRFSKRLQPKLENHLDLELPLLQYRVLIGWMKEMDPR